MIPEGCPSGQREQTVNLPALAYGGSNPPPSTDVPLSFGFVLRDVSEDSGEHANAGVAQLVERQPSKLNVAGSNPVARSEQSRFLPVSSRPGSSVVEHLLGKEEVVGSIPILGSSPLV